MEIGGEPRVSKYSNLSMPGKIAFFGCPLDCDEREEAIQEKLTLMEGMALVDDPYERVMELVRQEVDPALWLEKGAVPIPSWLQPLPAAADRPKISAEEFVRFIDRNGCQSYAALVGQQIAETIHPDIPGLIAVDHSLTGGAFRKLAELYGLEKISLIVLDSHTDALPVPVMAEAIQYDLETNPDSLHDPNDPFLYNRPDSYNTSSFLDHLIAEGIVLPQHLYILGVSDFPPKQAFRIKDHRIEKFVGHFSKLKKQGVTLLTKNDLVLSPSKVKSVLKQIRTPWVYISIDLDIGARNALEGVRFLDRQGLSAPQMLRLVGYLREILNRGTRLAGFDLCEINTRTAGQDQTYRIAVDVIKKLIWAL